ncbi:MAG TPA: Rrf2 family transcriptional regulator [Acidimicrobiia bacterium]|nr:Rrf2 family transcriptional regulator [Acidimicrobiia bacterium]
MRLALMRRTDLALRVLRLLERSPGSWQASELANAVDSTTQFIPQVLKPMVRAGWISSVSGPRGGYRLAMDLDSRTLLELIELIEGPVEDGKCVLESTECDATHPCALHGAWTWARDGLIERLGQTVISGRTHGKANP